MREHFTLPFLEFEKNASQVIFIGQQHTFLNAINQAFHLLRFFLYQLILMNLSAKIEIQHHSICSLTCFQSFFDHS
jgi:hypothetical protein